jgi:tRNA A37 methylthiotransferase MiaB
MDVVVLQQQGETPEQILETYDFLNLAQIHAALSYYYDNPEVTDAQLKADEERDARFEREKIEFLKHRASSSSR